MSTPEMPGQGTTARYDAVVFDLLTALIDSWTLWNDVAGGEAAGQAWRQAYLRITYGCGEYRPYEDLVAEAAAEAGLLPTKPDELATRWRELQAWPEVGAVLSALAPTVRLGVVTNCSRVLGNMAANQVFPGFDAVVTAEDAGYYKPRPEPYSHCLTALGTLPERTLFVAGSAADVPGAMGVGMTVYWHNRIGLPATGTANPAWHESDLHALPALV